MAADDLISEIKFWLNAILSPLSLILNSILFFMIKYKSSKNLKDYKKVLFLGCNTDFFFALWNIIAQPDITTVGNVNFMFTRGLPGYLPFPWTAWSFPISIYFMYLSVANVPIQFFYRYLFLCWGIILNKWMFLCLVGIGSGSIFAYCYFFVYYLITRKENDLFYAHMLNGSSEWMVNGKIPYFGAFPFESFAYAFYISFSIVIISYLIVFFYGFKIFRHIRKSDQEFYHTKYQKQITIVMTVEAVIPFITAAFPILLDLTTVLMGTPLAWAGKVVYLLGALAPVINPCVKLSVISCYRRNVLAALKFRKYFGYFSPIIAPATSTHINNNFPSSSNSV